jgi:integrase
MSEDHIRKRGNNSWEIRFDLGPDPLTKKRRMRTKTVRGSEDDAEQALRDVLTVINKGKEQAETLLKLGVRQTDQNFVFATWDGKLRSPNGFTSEFGRIVKRLGIADLGFHSLRHTHASALLRAREPITAVSKRLGHKDASITLSIYSHVMKGMDEELASTTDQIMNSVMGDLI